MMINLNTVKTQGRSYHHGDLRLALIDAGRELVEQRGLDQFSLRETARRAGVSPAAPAHHFGDTRGLLTAIATAGFREFGDVIEAARGADRDRTIVLRCHAYLDFALDRPGLFRLMWRKTMLDMDDPDHLDAAHRVFAMMDKLIRGDEASYTRPDDPQLAPTVACWSIVHGFTMLVLDGASFGPAVDNRVSLKAMLDGLLAQLTVVAG